MRLTTHKHYVLGVLTIILLFNYIDRVALGVVLESIKADFDLSDTELGVLGGIAFALFYSIMGIPIARWADRGNRVTIIASTCALWSAAVALCGLVTSFAQLLLVRVLVAIGEAGCLPPAFSLIADYFNRAERPRAIAIYGLGGVFSTVIGYFLAGQLNDHYGWRITFVVLGLPGLLLASLAWFTLREPRTERLATNNERVVRMNADLDGRQRHTIAAEFATLWSNVTFRRLLMCLVGMLFFNFGIGQWLPAFFIRSHGFTAERIGTALAIVNGASGLLGAYVGGELASRYAAQNESLQLRMTAIAVACSGAAAIFIYVTSDANTALVLLGVHYFFTSAVNGPLFGTMQTVVQERMRAMAFALAYLVANLIGAGFGPLAAGALSDLYQRWVHEQSLSYALLTLAPGYFIIAWYAWRGSTSVAGDLAAVVSEADRLQQLVAVKVRR